ncbi:hypothetical protein [Aliishimia ponticola]|nr:hypothetical protein [Aliishimia ponticola]
MLAPTLLWADAQLTRLYDLLEFDAYLEVTRIEGMREIEDGAPEMLGRSADGGYLAQMARVYDADRMRETILYHLERGLNSQQIDAALVFFGSDLGMRITEFEVAARRAISDTDVEESARDAWLRAEETHPWLSARIHDFIDVSDLIERNVSGALNSNLRFYQGLVDGGSIELTQDEMLIEVWAQEPALRDDTESWMGGYLLLAYQPLSQTDITDYLAFWKTDTGRALNAAVFAGYNALYDEISYATGRIIALNVDTQEL